jgi:tryptophanyl-tRNA synthetase
MTEKACDHSGSIIGNFIWKQKKLREIKQLCTSGKTFSCLRLLAETRKNWGNTNSAISITRTVASKKCSQGKIEDCAIAFFMDCFTDKKESAFKKLEAACAEGSINACSLEKQCLNPWP